MCIFPGRYQRPGLASHPVGTRSVTGCVLRDRRAGVPLPSENGLFTSAPNTQMRAVDGAGWELGCLPHIQTGCGSPRSRPYLPQVKNTGAAAKAKAGSAGPPPCGCSNVFVGFFLLGWCFNHLLIGLLWLTFCDRVCILRYFNVFDMVFSIMFA